LLHIHHTNRSAKITEMQVVVPLVNGGTLCNTLAIGERPQPPHQGGAVKGSPGNKKPAPGAWL
jgi:hypothetical protein